MARPPCLGAQPPHRCRVRCAGDPFEACSPFRASLPLAGDVSHLLLGWNGKSAACRAARPSIAARRARAKKRNAESAEVGAWGNRGTHRLQAEGSQAIVDVVEVIKPRSGCCEVGKRLETIKWKLRSPCVGPKASIFAFGRDRREVSRTRKSS